MYLVTQSNKYDQQKNINLNLTKSGINEALGVMFLLGYTKCSNNRMYWSGFDGVLKMF